MDDRRFQIKIEGPAVLDGQISFSLLSQLLKGIQETVYTLALAGLQYDYRQRIRVPREVQTACALYRVLEENGSYALTAEIAPAQHLADFPDIGLYAKNKYLEVIHILEAENSWDKLNRVIPDSGYRRKILRSISSYCPKSGERWHIGIGQPGQQLSTLNPGLPQSIHKFLVLPATETMVVSGELVQLHLDEKRLGIYYAPAKKVIHCSYEPELEDYIVSCLREIIQVYGQVQLDNRGIPEKIVDVIEIENLDLSPLKIGEILFENKKLLLRDELSISVDYDQENQEFSLEYPILNISIGAKDRQAILDEFYADFYWIWLEYGICDEAQMSDDARLLKESVCGMVVEEIGI